MRWWDKIGWIVLLWLAAATTSVHAQSALLMELKEQKLLSSADHAHLSKHLETLEKKRAENDRAFLYRIFWSIRKEFLHTYSPHQPISSLFEHGLYDCLTATTLYAIVLEHFAYSFKIVETNYHIFILASTAKGEILLEATDPYNGFVESSDQINNRLSSYKQNITATRKPDVVEYKFHFNIFGEVASTHLPNLLHYNQAINAFNDQKWIKCAEHLQAARLGYSSARVKELAALLVESVSENSTVTDEVKDFIIAHFRNEWIEAQPLVLGR